MSSTEWLAKVVTTNPSVTLFSTTSNQPNGSPFNVVNERQLEEMTTPGVQGVRYRTRLSVPPEQDIVMTFPLTGAYPVSTFGELEQLLFQMVGRIGTLIIRRTEQDSEFSGQFFILDWQTTQRGGKLAGFGQETNSTNTLRGTMRIRWTGDL